MMLRIKRIKSKDLMIFCRQFSTLINAGVTVLVAVIILKDQQKGRPFSKALAGVITSLENGQSLSGSFALEGKAFPRLFVSMIEAGESGGRVDEVLKRLAEFYEKDHDLRERIKGALIYPALILGPPVSPWSSLSAGFCRPTPIFSSILARNCPS
jgi:type IV pilus assembly protein PilC